MRQAGIGQHHIDIARRQPGRDRGRRVAGHRNRAVRHSAVHPAASRPRRRRRSRKIRPRRLSIADPEAARRPDTAATSASASPTVTPITGTPTASAMPCASARPARMPVKLPGPTVTATRSRSMPRAIAASASTSPGHHRQQRGMPDRRGLLADGYQLLVDHDSGGASGERRVQGQDPHRVADPLASPSAWA